MNDSQAKRALVKLLGKNAAWQRNEKALRADERAEVEATLPALSNQRQAAKVAMEERRKALLQDPTYLELVKAHSDAVKAHVSASGAVRSRRVTVGVLHDVAGLSMFSVRGEGDNWQEAIDAAKARVGK